MRQLLWSRLEMAIASAGPAPAPTSSVGASLLTISQRTMLML